MPWLSRQNSSDSTISVSSDDADIHDFLKKKPESVVSFVPAQIDGLCGTRSTQQRATPMQILTSDIKLFAQHLRCAPVMVTTLYRERLWQRYRDSYSSSKDAALQGGLAILQLWILCTVIPAFLFLPGAIFIGLALSFWMMNFALSWSFNRKQVVTVKRSVAPMTEDLSDERWFYVNGSMTSDRALQSHCKRLSQTFSRPVTGIHNSTHGPVSDFITTLFLRAFAYPTSCTRTLTSHLRDALLSNTTRKVIILSHSTGALHISLALDILHADLPTDILSKLEVYTFGACTSHLSNPLLRLESLKSAFSPTETAQAHFTRADGTIKSPVKATLASLGHRVEDHERVIPHIEHYAMQNDLFARWGILHAVKNVLDGRFCGRTFIFNSLNGSNSGDGWLFDHYLDQLLPLTGRSSMLDEIVNVDSSTAEKREFTAMGVALPMKSIIHPDQRRDSWEGMMGQNGGGGGSPEVSPRGNAMRNMSLNGMSRAEKRASWGTAGAMGIDGVGKARMGARECEGRTVRQLSRLWRYAQGGRPVGEGVAVMNGVGHGIGGMQ